MSEHLISLFIDDELDLDAKIEFVEIVHADGKYKDETLGLLRMEKRLRAETVHRMPDFKPVVRRSFWKTLPVPALGTMAAGLAAAAILLALLWPSPKLALRPYRFVIYQPEARSVEIAGTFTGWKRVPLRHAGSGGYWELTLELPEGDHRFSYIVEGGRRLADPTLARREKDDFGGENSILTVEL